MSTQETAPETPPTVVDDTAEVTTPADGADTPEDDQLDDDQDIYPASVVKDLRDKNAKYRTRARDAETRADTLAERLHTALVRADGRLADPADLTFDAAHLDDPDALTAAIDALLAARPHYAARKLNGAVGQGITESVQATPSWSNLISGKG